MFSYGFFSKYNNSVLSRSLIKNDTHNGALLLIMKVKTISSMILRVSYTRVGLLYESTISLYKRNKLLPWKGQRCIYNKQQPACDDCE